MSEPVHNHEYPPCKQSCPAFTSDPLDRHLKHQSENTVTFSHNLNDKDVIVSVFSVTHGDSIPSIIEVVDKNTIKIPMPRFPVKVSVVGNDGRFVGYVEGDPEHGEDLTITVDITAHPNRLERARYRISRLWHRLHGT